MDVRYLNVLRALLDKYPESVTAQNLSAELAVSLRGVRNYVKEINALYPGAILPSRSGYSVNAETVHALLSTNREVVPQTAKQRTSYLLKTLLQRQSVNRFDVCEELFISLSTLQGVLSRVKGVLAEFDLKLEAAKDLLSISGTEQNKRHLYSHVLYEESHSNFMDAESIQKAFPDVDVSEIRACVDEVLSNYRLFANDYTLANLTLHIAIAVDRIRSGNVNTSHRERMELVDPQKRKAAQEIAQLLTRRLKIAYTECEVDELTLLLTYWVSFVDADELGRDTLSEFVEASTLELVKEIALAVREVHGVDLNDEFFFVRFALHIHNLLKRCKNYRYNKNPLTESIKFSSPLIYEIAVYISSLVQERTGVVINDDEIAYIAMHLGNALCTQNEFERKIKAALYCPDYYDMNAQLARMITERFSSDIVLIKTCADEAQLRELENCELILTTVPIGGQTPCDFVKINAFLQGKSVGAVKQAIEMIQLRKRRAKFESYLRHIIAPELFEVSDAFENSKQVIRHMVDRLVAHGYVAASFEDEVLERERISSTAFNGFAAPHSLKMDAFHTGLYILLSPHAIEWRDKQVQLVLMLCFKSDERHIFHEIFDSLAMILNDSASFARLIQCKDYETFIQLVCSLIE